MKWATSQAIMLLVVFSILMAGNTQNARATEYHEYQIYNTYDNIRTCFHTDGGGIWIESEITNYLDEIGVLEITEQYPVYRAEVYGAGCYYPATLTCNGITKEASYYHDSEPQGWETLNYDISPSTVVIFYTSIHFDTPETNHGFHPIWVRLYYAGTGVPEFPLGLAMPIAILPLLLSLWWKRRRKTSP